VEPSDEIGVSIGAHATVRIANLLCRNGLAIAVLGAVEGTALAQEAAKYSKS
jgi:hypothetical protein